MDYLFLFLGLALLLMGANYLVDASVAIAQRAKISNFIKKPASGNGYINLNRVSSVKFDNSKNRIIFNFANSIDFMNHNAQNAQFKITSEFIYCDFTDPDKFMAESESVKNAMLKL